MTIAAEFAARQDAKMNEGAEAAEQTAAFIEQMRFDVEIRFNIFKTMVCGDKTVSLSECERIFRWVCGSVPPPDGGGDYAQERAAAGPQDKVDG